MKLDNRIVPEELIVGITGDLCYVTYEVNGKLNSETSWTNWSNNSDKPLRVNNEFSKGFVINGVNGRWSNQASNSDNLLIKHPLFDKSFELSLSRFCELASNQTIVDGEFQEEMIMDFNRNLLTRDEYEQRIIEHDIKDEEQRTTKLKNNENKVNSKDQVPGKAYLDRKNNKHYVFLGSVIVDDVKKFVYSELDGYYWNNEFESHTISNRYRNGSVIGSVRHPSIISYGYYDENYTRGDLSVVKTKKSMSLPKEELRNINIYDSYDENDWKSIYEVYNKKGKFRYGSYEENWAKSKEAPSIRFKEDYEEHLNKL